MNKRMNGKFEILSSVRINDEVEIVMGRRTTQFGTDYATWECSNENNYYWGHYDFKTMPEASLDMCARAIGKLERVSPQTSEIDKMREQSNINFSVVSIDGDVEYFSGNFVNEDNIENDEAYLNYVEDCCYESLNVSVDYYNWGDKTGEEPVPATPEQLKLIRENWDKEVGNSTLIESGKNFSINLDNEENFDLDMDY